MEAVTNVAAAEEIDATADAVECGARPELTLAEIVQIQSTATKVESEARDTLAAKVEDVRKELMALLDANSKRDDDDLEKLPASAFIIDQPQQAAWHADGTTLVNELKYAIEQTDIGNELVRSRMHAEFWSAMEAPMVTVHAMSGGDYPAKATCGSYTMPNASATSNDALHKVVLIPDTRDLGARA